MRPNEWRRVRPGKDEYAREGDTFYVESAKYAYYWNERNKVVRRYGADGEYCELPCHGMPTPYSLSELFYKNKSKLQNVEKAA